MSYAVLCPADRFNHDELVRYAQLAEDAGLDTIWLPELLGRDPFVTCASVLAATSSIRVGTAIANVYVRDARATKAAAFSLADAHGNRFELGLGLSNKVGNSPRGHEWLSPLLKMRDFIDRYDSADMMFHHNASVSVYLAAHGPKLMAFAAERLDGAYTYLQTIDYSKYAKHQLGPKKLHLMQPTVMLEDPTRARELARRAISVYLPLENYHRAWRERGFEEGDFADRGSDHFIDAIVAWGNPERVNEHYQAQFAAGVDQIIIIPVGIDLKADTGWENLRAHISS